MKCLQLATGLWLCATCGRKGRRKVYCKRLGGMLSDIENWKGCPRNIALEIEPQEELQQKKMRHSALGQESTTHALFTLHL